MSALPWFRLHSRLMSDPDVEDLSTEDQRHYVWLLCCKNEGYLDKPYSAEKLHRVVARKLGLDLDEAHAVQERLVEAGLVNQAWQPRSWESLQMRSDVDPTNAERQARYRAKKRNGVTAQPASQPIEKVKENPLPDERNATRNAPRNALVTRLDKDKDLDKKDKENRLVVSPVADAPASDADASRSVVDPPTANNPPVTPAVGPALPVTPSADPAPALALTPAPAPPTAPPSAAQGARTKRRPPEAYFEAALAAYHRYFPASPIVLRERLKPHQERYKSLTALYRDEPITRDPEFWEDFFCVATTNPWWTGEKSTAQGDNFHADFAFLVRRRNFDRVLEMGIDQHVRCERRAARQSARQSAAAAGATA